MMRFQFTLEGLLRVRQLLEDQARERLDQCRMRVAALERSLAEAQQWCLGTAALCASGKDLPAVELQYIESILRQTREAISRCQQQKQAEEQRAAELRAAYLQARRERKTVSTLRENALRQFQIEQSRRQQSELDDHFLGRVPYTRPTAAGAQPDEMEDKNLT